MDKAKVKYEAWLDYEFLDSEIKQELKNLDEEEIYDRFYRNMDFGTGGIRGILGAGTNRLNIYTIKRISRGFAKHLKGKEVQPSVAIGFDNREKSRLFALESAKVFAAVGIKVFLSEDIMPTPQLSFAVRHYNCTGGVMITASHNPKEYNGYKIYDEMGCQCLPDEATKVAKIINRLDYFSEVNSDYDESLLEYISQEFDKEYIDAVYKERIGIRPKNISVLFTPLNGAGAKRIPEIFDRIRLNEVSFVEAQMEADPNFTTCKDPNPEKIEAFSLALDIAKKMKDIPDIILATDPDGDRVGVLVLHDGEYRHLSGNEVGILLFDFISEYVEIQNPLLIKTIVSSKMPEAIAEDRGIDVLNLLTGFKYIGAKIAELDERENNFLFGFEESCGYLKGTYARDKDAVVACMLIAEMCENYKRQNKTIIDKLNELYEEYGYYKNVLVEHLMPGEKGMSDIRKLMKKFRNERTLEIFESKPIIISDYLKQSKRVLGGGCDMSVGTRPTELPIENAMEFIFEDGSNIIVRPSGTEPKIKIYIGVNEETEKKADAKLRVRRTQVESIIKGEDNGT